MTFLVFRLAVKGKRIVRSTNPALVLLINWFGGERTN